MESAESRGNLAPESLLSHGLKESVEEPPLGMEHFAVQPRISAASGLIEDEAVDWPLAFRPSSSYFLRQYLELQALHVFRWTVMTLHVTTDDQIFIFRSFVEHLPTDEHE